MTSCGRQGCCGSRFTHQGTSAGVPGGLAASLSVPKLSGERAQVMQQPCSITSITSAFRKANLLDAGDVRVVVDRLSIFGEVLPGAASAAVDLTSGLASPTLLTAPLRCTSLNFVVPLSSSLRLSHFLPPSCLDGACVRIVFRLLWRTKRRTDLFVGWQS